MSCSSQASDQAAASTTSIGSAESPDIQITVAGQAPGTAYLIAQFTDQRYRLDTAVVESGGQVRFQRDEPYPAGVVYVLLPGNISFPLVIDQDQTMTLQTQASDPIANMQADGNVDTELLYEAAKYDRAYNAKVGPITQQLRTMNESAPNYAQLKAQQDQLVAERRAFLQEMRDQHPNSLFVKFKMAGQNPDIRDIRLPNGERDVAAQAYFYRREFWDNVDLTDERLLRTPVIHNKLERYITEMTAQHHDSIIQATDHLVRKVIDQPNSEYFKFFTNWVALKYQPGETSLMDAEAVQVHIVQNYFTQDRAFWAGEAEVYAMQQRANEMAASRIGLKGPDVVSTDPNGQQRSIYELKDPYVVVFMYNPECDHCIEETPQLLRVYRQAKSQGLGVQVFAIAIDTENEKWKTFINQNGLQEWVHVFDPTNESIYGKYFVDNTPEIYVLDPDRTIIAKNLNPDQILAVIERDRSRNG